MLGAGHRMRRRDEFTSALRAGRRARRGELVVCVGTADNNCPAKAGFIVSRAVGNAVVRNTVRRRLRHLMRERIAAQPRRTLVVVRALADAGSRSYAQMANDLDAALASADPRTGAIS